ncbi:MAG: GH32 C-terminal domain-containing protein, partial [Bullifex sp.]|nr:GH32 C-terminal domain-containing protein [Bullifex sp.]
RAFIHQRRCQAREVNGSLKLRIILDRYSAEVFVNDGEKTITATIMTEDSAKGISFFATGEAVIDVEKYSLEEKEAK